MPSSVCARAGVVMPGAVMQSGGAISAAGVTIECGAWAFSSCIEVSHQPAKLRSFRLVAELVLEPFEAPPQHRLIAVDDRLAERLFDRGHSLDLRRVGAAQEYAVSLGCIVLAGQLEPLLRRYSFEICGGLALERDIFNDRNAS